MIMAKGPAQVLLHYKTSSPVEIDAGNGLASGSSGSTFASSAGTWQNVGVFEAGGWSRLGLCGIASQAVSLRLQFGYLDSSGSFVPLGQGSTLSLATSSAVGDALSSVVVAPYARLQLLNESGSAATVDLLVTGLGA